MIHLAVVHQTLPVVREQNDQRLVVDPKLLETPDQAGDHRIRGGHLPVVRVVVAAGKWRRRRVRGVRLVQVEKQEEGRTRHPSEPLRRSRQRLRPGTLKPAQLPPGLESDLVVVDVEPPGDPGTGAQDVG